MSKHIKIVLFGDTNVGKTSIVEYAVSGEFKQQHNTSGAAFQTIERQYENDTIIFDIWDTAGQEQYQSLAPMYFRNAMVGIAVFDLTDESTLEKLNMWLDQYHTTAGSDAEVILVGNKCDLSEQRAVDYTIAIRFQEMNQISSYVETSALTGQGIEDIFRAIYENPSIYELAVENQKHNVDEFGITSSGALESVPSTSSQVVDISNPESQQSSSSGLCC